MLASIEARKWSVALAAFAALGVASPQLLAKPPDNWDGLTRVQAKRLDAVYIRPQANFAPYSKVMIDQPQIAFESDWQKDYNSSRRDPSARVRDKDIRRAIDGATERFSELLRAAYQKEGYSVVAEPGEDVLRVSTAVINVKVAAPDQMTAGRSRTYSSEAGEATLVVEARDSLSGSLLGRALDRRAAGDGAYTLELRNSVTNYSDFERLFSTWAKISATGLTKLKTMYAH